MRRGFRLKLMERQKWIETREDGEDEVQQKSPPQLMRSTKERVRVGRRRRRRSRNSLNVSVDELSQKIDHCREERKERRETFWSQHGTQTDLSVYFASSTF